MSKVKDAIKKRKHTELTFFFKRWVESYRILKEDTKICRIACKKRKTKNNSLIVGKQK